MFPCSNELAVELYEPHDGQVSPNYTWSSPESLSPTVLIDQSDVDLFRALTTIPPYLRCDDIWKDARQTLSPALQGLLYHYEYTTSLTLATDDLAKTAWQTFVPELASRYQFVVHNVLAIASLHLGRLHGNGTNRSAMTNIAVAQMNRALAGFRPELENINADNAAALFASSTLTAVYFFRTSTLDIDEIRASVPAGTIVPSQQVVDAMFLCVLRTIHGLRGPLAVLIPGWSYVLKGRMRHVADREWWPGNRLPATERAMEEDRRLAKIERLWQDLSNPSFVNADCLTSALFYLREVYGLISQLSLPHNDYPSTTSISYSVDDKTVGILKDRGAVFVWASRISRDFIRLLEQKNREALVIVAHYAVLPGRVRNTWWLEGFGANIITAVAMALGRENWHLIDWPVRVIGVDLENAFTARADRLEGQPEEMSMELI